jgi:hypothetical protein
VASKLIDRRAAVPFNSPDEDVASDRALMLVHGVAIMGQVTMTA